MTATLFFLDPRDVKIEGAQPLYLLTANVTIMTNPQWISHECKEIYERACDTYSSAVTIVSDIDEMLPCIWKIVVEYAIPNPNIIDSLRDICITPGPIFPDIPIHITDVDLDVPRLYLCEYLCIRTDAGSSTVCIHEIARAIFGDKILCWFTEIRIDVLRSKIPVDLTVEYLIRCADSR